MDAAGRGAALIVALIVALIATLAAPTAVLAEQPADKPSALDAARTHFERGHAAYGAGRLKEALAELQRAWALAPSAELAFDLGRVCERLAEADLAIAYFGAYLDRAQLSDAEKTAVTKRIDALRALQKRQRTPLLQPPPSTAALDAEAHAFFTRGIRLFDQGHYAGALAAFEAARRNAALPELAYDMALTAERLGQLSDAIDYYREYLRKAQSPPDAVSVQAHIAALERQTVPAQR